MIHPFQPKISQNVHDIKILQPRPAVTLDRRIPAHRAVTHPRRQIDGLHAIFIPPPAKRRPFCRDFFFLGLQPLFQPPVGGENCNLVASPRQAFGKRAHFYGGTAEFEKGSVRFRDVQDSHCSRRIFFSDLAKTPKRNSYSTRWRPRAPISLPSAGSARRVSMEVAN